MLTADIYKRYKEGNYSKDDFRAIKSAMQQKEGSMQLDILMREDWFELNKSQATTDKDLQHILHKIHYQINHHIPQKRNAARKIWAGFSKIAAVILILISTTFAIFHNKIVPTAGIEISHTRIYAPPGSRSEFTLPDSTKGWLNTGSSLEYQIPFKNNRHVVLNGEAFFNVASDKNSPFTVESSGLNVKVLGTQFNVMAYGNDPVSEVVLVEGEVEITDYSGRFMTKLDVNQKFTVDKNKKTATVENINTEKYIAWKEGKLIFRNDPLPVVVKKLGRWYNAEFVLQGKELYEMPFRATFVNEQLPEVLRLLSLSAPISYKIENRVMNHENEFLKRKVILMYNKN